MNKRSLYQAYYEEKPSQQEIWDKMWAKVEYTISDSKILSQWHLFDMVKCKFMEKILPDKNSHCLECGCGGAVASIHLAKKGCVVTAFDISPEALRVALANSNKAGVTINLLRGDIEKIPFYIYFMKILMPFWEWFDKSSSNFTNVWGAGWWAYGNKG